MKKHATYKFQMFFSVLFLLVLAVFLYFYKLDKVPNGLYVDEAVSGYNSFSLLKTGMDEYGKAMPIALRFFASYTPPLYAYASIVPIYLFNLTVFSTRFIGAFSGVISVFVAYLFMRELNILTGFKRVFGATLFSICPWVVFYSRVGYEVYFAFLLFSLGAYFSFKALSKINYLPLSFVFLILSAYASHTQKYLFLIWIPLYFLIFYSNLYIKRNFRVIVISFIIALLLTLPYVTIANTLALQSKNSLFYSNFIIERAHQSPLPQLLGVPISACYEFLSRYATYFSPKSLFFIGDPDPQRSIPELSMFYFWMIIPYFIGLFSLYKKRQKIQHKFLIFLLFISPLPAALTHDPFSTQRALPVFLPITLVILLGISNLFEAKKRAVTLLLILFSCVYSPLMLWRSYFVLFPVEKADAWGYGYNQLIDEITKHTTTTYVIDQTRLKPVYIEYAFYAQYDPKQMQSLYSSEFVKNYYNEPQFNSPVHLGRVYFRPIIWEQDLCTDQILVGDNLSFSPSNIKEHFLSLEFTIRDPKNNIVFVGYKTHPELKCKKEK